jgi:hypothetical protein
VKKREGTDVIEVKINVSKTQKETGRDYKFTKTHQTAKVAFYDYNPYEGEGVKHLLVEVPIEKIASNSYSLNYSEYMKDDAEEEQYEEGVVVKSIKELFKFNTGSLQAMKCDESDTYPVISSSNIHTHSSFELDGENIFEQKKLAPGIIVMGNEGNGLSTEIRSVIQHKLSIPKFGNAESLNVSVATGIIVSSFFKN